MLTDFCCPSWLLVAIMLTLSPIATDASCGSHSSSAARKASASGTLHTIQLAGEDREFFVFTPEGITRETRKAIAHAMMHIIEQRKPKSVLHAVLTPPHEPILSLVIPDAREGRSRLRRPAVRTRLANFGPYLKLDNKGKSLQVAPHRVVSTIEQMRRTTFPIQVLIIGDPVFDDDNFRDWSFSDAGGPKPGTLTDTSSPFVTGVGNASGIGTVTWFSPSPTWGRNQIVRQRISDIYGEFFPAHGLYFTGVTSDLEAAFDFDRALVVGVTGKIPVNSSGGKAKPPVSSAKSTVSPSSTASNSSEKASSPSVASSRESMKPVPADSQSSAAGRTSTTTSPESASSPSVGSTRSPGSGRQTYHSERRGPWDSPRFNFWERQSKGPEPEVNTVVFNDEELRRVKKDRSSTTVAACWSADKTANFTDIDLYATHAAYPGEVISWVKPRRRWGKLIVDARVGTKFVTDSPGDAWYAPGKFSKRWEILQIEGSDLSAVTVWAHMRAVNTQVGVQVFREGDSANVIKQFQYRPAQAWGPEAFNSKVPMRWFKLPIGSASWSADSEFWRSAIVHQVGMADAETVKSHEPPFLFE